MPPGCAQGGAEPRWGEETTEESEGEVAHYSARRKEILDNAATVFADAAEEYGSLPVLKARLESWKATHSGEHLSSLFLCPHLAALVGNMWQFPFICLYLCDVHSLDELL